MTTTTTTQKYTVHIASIVCEATADTGNANDEVFVIWQADGGIPVRYPADNYQKMNTTADPDSDVVSTWNIPAGDLNLTFEKEVLVTLWDSTVAIDPSSSVYLMSYEYTAPGINPGYPASETSYTMSNHNGGKYTINASTVSAVSTASTLQAEVSPHFDAIKTKLNQTAPRAVQSGGPNAVPENEAQFVRVLTDVVKAWKASPEGAASLEKMRGLDLKGIHAELDSIVKGPHISGALQLAAGDGQIDFSLFQSFSISLAITGEVFVGLYGAIGYACDMSVVKGEGGNTGIYLCGAFVEEVGAGLDGLVEAGVWKLSLKDLGGSYSALAIDIGDVEGEEVGYFQFKSDDTTQGYVVGVGIGEDYEVGDMDPAYIFILPVTSSYPVMQVDASNCLILTKLECLNKLAQADGHDEVTLYITADAPATGSTTYRYPTWDDFAMGDDSGDFNIWYPGRSVMFNSSVTVTASDSGTELGSFTFSPQDFSGVGSTVSPTSNPDGPGFQKISYQMTAMLITLATAQGDTMNPGETLSPGQSIRSENGLYEFIMQTDGNLVLYNTENVALWNSGTNGKPVTMCIMQGDGNLVLYQSGPTADWASNTDGHPGSYLTVEDDGHVTIYDPNGTSIWSKP
jgi:hypothetical protein